MEKILKNIKPRKYQQEIVEKCIQKNCLVVLPTGVGKTLIALMLVIERMKKFPLKKILFLAPTRPLAEQHLKYFQKHLGELFGQMELFTGKVKSNERKKIWQRAEIIFSTPQCIGNDLKKNLYTLEDISLLIEDEAHRCVKNYSYTFVAKKYIEQGEDIRILGMTASPGTDKKTIKDICENLSIEEVEVRTRESEDVKEYLQEAKIKVIKVEFPEKFKEIRNYLKRIIEKNVSKLRERNLIFGPANKITLLETQKKMSNMIRNNNKNPMLFNSVSVCAQTIKVMHALELLETQTLHSLKTYMENLNKQGEKNQSRAAKNLVSQFEFVKAMEIINELISKKIEHPKLLELKDLLKQKISENKDNKTIIFTQFRDSVSKICEELNKNEKISAKPFIGQTKREERGLSQKEQKKIIEGFSEGKFNTLIATSIGEEGLDIPEVNSVIFYEPVPSAIRKIQRAGRTARLMPGEIIMLVTTGTRDEIYYWSAHHKEKRMHKAIDSIKEELKNGKIDFKSPQKQLF